MLHTAVDVIDRKRRGEPVPDEIVVEPRFDEKHGPHHSQDSAAS